jgi:hypothetical protein
MIVDLIITIIDWRLLTTLCSGFESCTLATSNGVAASFAKSTKTTTTTIYEVQGSPYYLFALGPLRIRVAKEYLKP